MSLSGRRSRLSVAIIAGLALLFAALLARRAIVHAQSPGQNQLTVYSPQTSYSIPLLEVNSQPYVGLVELFEPLGQVDARVDGKKYKLHFTPPGGRPLEVQFTEGKDKGKVRGKNYKLPANFVVQNGRGYVPLSVISEIISKLLQTDCQLNPASRRLLIGNVQVHYTLELHKDNPSRLLLGFSSPVNPTIATEPGRVRLTFRREPVVSSGADNVTYSDPLIKGATFSEHDGVAELDVTGTAPMMANFADGNRTIIITAAPAPPPVAQQVPPPSAPAPTTTQNPAPPPPPPAAPRFLVLIDPAHGGSDIGAAITPSLPEKDVVLALARLVQRELANRGIAATLLRNSDVTISLDQRAISANAMRPALYIALHAANTGRGVHVFTSLLPAANLSPQGFLPWDTAQAAFLDLSGSVAGSVAAELESRKLPNTTLLAPLRPMNNIAAPAIAVEIAPPAANVDEIASAAYQDQVAQSIAAGVAAVRAKLPEVRP
ncbi:MAG: N-acetylmuramoyl-L-alanine amidase [Candidatus Korobacteraceae bacterium]